jgi:hypothetical protein
MLKHYRMHGEQIASIAQTMKEMYNVRRVDSDVSGRSESGGATRSLHTDRGMEGGDPRLAVIMMPTKRKTFQRFTSPGSVPHSAPAHRDLLPVQCFRCGDAFPETDFLYTKKSGLCISCWERKIKVV